MREGAAIGDSIGVTVPRDLVGEVVAAARPAATAWPALFRHGRLRFGETVCVGGGAGNVGSAAVVRLLRMTRWRLVLRP